MQQLESVFWVVWRPNCYYICSCLLTLILTLALPVSADEKPCPSLRSCNCSDESEEAAQPRFSSDKELVVYSYRPSATCSGLNLTELPIYFDPNLRLLDLSWNRLSVRDGEMSPWFAQLHTYYQLRSLYLSHNLIQSLGPFDLAKVVWLERLDVSFNLIAHVHTQALRKTPRLRFLNLANNRIQEFLPEFLQFSPTLGTLNVEENLISDLDFLVNSSVATLRIGGNGFASNFWSNLSQTFPSVKSLSLRATHFNYSSLQAIVTAFPFCQTFDLSACNLSSLNLDDLYNSTENTFWNLTDNRITLLLKQPHQFLQSNFTIDLTGNPFTCDCNLFAVARQIAAATFHRVLHGVRCFPDNASLWENFESKCFPIESFLLPAIISAMVSMVVVCGLIMLVVLCRRGSKCHKDSQAASGARWQHQSEELEKVALYADTSDSSQVGSFGRNQNHDASLLTQPEPVYATIEECSPSYAHSRMSPPPVTEL